MRAVDALIGSATVIGVFLLAFWATNRPKVALASAAVAALLPMNAFLSGAVSNDPLLIALCSFTLAFGVRVRSTQNWNAALLLAIFASLAFWTKASALVLVFSFPFFIRDRRKLAAVTALWAVSILPLVLRNQALYGDPIASGVFRATFPPEIDPSAFHSPKGFALWTYTLVRHTVESLIGIFGYMDIHLPKGVSWTLGIALVFSAGCGVRRLPAPSKTGLLLFAAIIGVAFVAFNVTYIQPQARYLFPALAPFCLAAVLGAERIFKERARFAIGLFILGLFGANFYAFTLLPEGYALREEQLSLREHPRNQMGSDAPPKPSARNIPVSSQGMERPKEAKPGTVSFVLPRSL